MGKGRIFAHGRPRKHSDDAIAAALVKVRGVRSDAAHVLGYGYSTLLARIAASPLLQQVVRDQEAALLDTARRGVAAAIRAECNRAEVAEREGADLPGMVSSRWLLGQAEPMRLAVELAGQVQHEHTHEHTLAADADSLSEVLGILNALRGNGHDAEAEEPRLQ